MITGQENLCQGRGFGFTSRSTDTFLPSVSIFSLGYPQSALFMGAQRGASITKCHPPWSRGGTFFDATIYRVLAEEIRWGAVFPETSVRVLMLRARCSCLARKPAHSSR